MTIPTTPLQFPLTYSDNNLHIELPIRLSVLEGVNFKKTCDQILADCSPKQIILDCQQTKFMDSSGVGALVHLLKSTKEKNIDLVLINVGSAVSGVLSITNLDRVLTIKTQSEYLPINNNANTNQDLPATHPSIRSWIKRGIDIIGSIVGLIITAILFIPLALAIYIDDPGPIFFSQTRCGWLGKNFRIWKFRSMVTNAEQIKREVEKENELNDNKMYKNSKDPRVTKVGKLLRKTSLDELPQFWNVLKGEMSLVGTRPPTPDEVEKYEVPEWQRLDVKPGMTGEWQVKGRSNIRSFAEVIELDLNYQRNWSLKYDFQLILQTFVILFKKNSGAY